MQDLEEEIIKKLDFTVPLYYRYVDDTLSKSELVKFSLIESSEKNIFHCQISQF